MYDISINHYRRVLAGENPPPFRLNADGRGGTGKSFVIKLIAAHLQQLAIDDNQATPVLRAAPTGVAAHGISGRTLHRLAYLPLGGWAELSAVNRNTMQELFRDIRYLIIDKKSMIPLRALSYLDKRLREAVPSRSDEWFGGLSVMLCGDFFQLPPVADFGLFKTGTLRHEDHLTGRNAYFALRSDRCS